MKNKTLPQKVPALVLYTVLGILLSLAVGLERLSLWFSTTFRIGIREVIFTLRYPLKGADTDFMRSAIAFCDLKTLVLIFACVLLCALAFERIFSRVGAMIEVRAGRGRTFSFGVHAVLLTCFCLFVVFSLLQSLLAADRVSHFSDYMRARKSETKIYEEHYVRPMAEKIAGTGKNLIFIYMESMENTYASLSDGGRQAQINFIPHLTELAEQNVNFSNTEKLGGFHSCSGTGWTMGALFGSSTGVPFSFPVDGNAMDLREKFASGITALGDILRDKGYVQEFLCGSDGNFAGRKQFFEQHGDYKVFDLFTARERGYIPADYCVWWGFEDEFLYTIAKDELASLAVAGKPFNFTMLTVDTHHVGGYKCRLCGSEYPENLMNVVSCADRQLYDFVGWCMEQDFYRDTTIVIMGDHPRMDSIMVEGVEYYDRTIYNCFINAAKVPEWRRENREFTTLDMFPTVLSALGFTIEGDRLGLGTDLFSGKKTFAEEWGFESFNSELSRWSRWYVENFS